MTVSEQLQELHADFDRKEELLFDAKHKGTIDPEEFNIEIHALCEWYITEYRRLKEEKCCEGVH